MVPRVRTPARLVTLPTSLMTELTLRDDLLRCPTCPEALRTRLWTELTFVTARCMMLVFPEVTLIECRVILVDLVEPWDIRLTDPVTLPTVVDVEATRRVRRLVVLVRRTVAVRALRVVVDIRIVALPTAAMRSCSVLIVKPIELVTVLATLLAIAVPMARLFLVSEFTLLSRCRTVLRPCRPSLLVARIRWCRRVPQVTSVNSRNRMMVVLSVTPKRPELNNCRLGSSWNVVVMMPVRLSRVRELSMTAPVVLAILNSLAEVFRTALMLVLILLNIVLILLSRCWVLVLVSRWTPSLGPLLCRFLSM